MVSPRRATPSSPSAMTSSSTSVSDTTTGRVGSPSRNEMVHSEPVEAMAVSPPMAGRMGARVTLGSPSVCDAGSAST